MDAPISGTCDSHFRSVRDEFVRNFSDREKLVRECVLS